MSIVNGLSTVVLSKMIKQYNGNFSGAAYSFSDPQYWTILKKDKKFILLPFIYRNRNVVVESIHNYHVSNTLKVYFN